MPSVQYTVLYSVQYTVRTVLDIQKRHHSKNVRYFVDYLQSFRVLS
jgi:hypothetical protein